MRVTTKLVSPGCLWLGCVQYGTHQLLLDDEPRGLYCGHHITDAAYQLERAIA